MKSTHGCSRSKAARWPSPSRAAHDAGTSIEIGDIYFNTPARRKFLKSEATEYAHCDETFKRIALARPDVAFKLVHNGRAQWHLPAAAAAKSGSPRCLGRISARRRCRSTCKAAQRG